jgi:hypothetical protein
MVNRLSTVVLACVLCVNCRPGAEAGDLTPADLSAAGISVDDDSASVLRVLGTPISRDSTTWRYDDLQVVINEGKVSILSLLGPTRRTPRGLRVGDGADKARRLYNPCYSDSILVQVCFNPTDFDARAVIAQLDGDRVKRIDVGRIIEP